MVVTKTKAKVHLGSQTQSQLNTHKMGPLSDRVKNSWMKFQAKLSFILESYMNWNDV
jgi:hypothetical protein